jgi:hypothetical protein
MQGEFHRARKARRAAPWQDRAPLLRRRRLGFEDLSVQEALMLSLIAALTLQAAATPPDFAWLEGHWRSEHQSGYSEEIWSGADGTLMTGMNRGVRDGAPSSFEFMRIEFTDPPVYIAQPRGGEPVGFVLSEHGASRALFANQEHDFPTHIAYARTGNALTARIWGADGEAEALIFTWQRKSH